MIENVIYKQRQYIEITIFSATKDQMYVKIVSVSPSAWYGELFFSFPMQYIHG